MTGGSLTGAQYTASYAYDALGRLTSAPLGSYTYGDPNHLDAATAVGATYSASYDAAGDMTCRAPTSSVTCSGGSPTGAAMSYDAERRLATWQNTPCAILRATGVALTALHDEASAWESTWRS